MELLIANTLVGTVRLALLLAFAWIIARFIFGYAPSRKVWGAAIAALALSTVWNLTKTNGVRFTLQDETREAPILTGQVKNSRPKLQTDAEREAENQSLYEQNKRGQ